ncbi:MAG: hypothetical protein LBO03_09350 [Acidaminococcales bacterium]|jgi:acyl-CoA hydrolase|nr:hypothetical protein [Acidaminococcales bacterium]
MKIDYTNIKPKRKGRLSDLPWREQVKQKTISCDDAAKIVNKGDRLYFPGAANFPQGFEKALAKRIRAEGLTVEIYTIFVIHASEIIKPEFKDNIFLYSHFLAGERSMQKQGNISFVPTQLGQGGKGVKAWRPRIAVLTCSPPNEDGWLSRSIWCHHYDSNLLDDDLDILIVEINKNLPFCYTEGKHHTLLHISEIDHLIEYDSWWPEVKTPPANAVDTKIGNYVTELVKNGDCLQIGLGGLADTVSKNMLSGGFKDLGIHTELLTNGLLDLIKAGCVNNTKKRVYPGKTVISAFVGDYGLRDYAEKNTDYLLLNVDFVNDPRVICQNDNVLSVNNCMEIDLVGQINAESIGPAQYSATGGQMEFVTGSQWSKGGRSVIALNSSFTDKSGALKSKIVPTLPLGSVVTTPRTFVNYVVTEYGMVDLKYKSVKDRAKLLISIAHPEFRDELAQQAKKLGFYS